MEYSIVTWDEKYWGAYKALSLEWLEKYVEVEPRDVYTIEHPYEVALNPGGMIWFAIIDGVAVGTISVILEQSGEWELAKLAVNEKYQGHGIGRELIKTSIDYAKSIGIKKLSLFTNSVLKEAIHLYHSFGFKDVEVTGESYITSDVKMELELN